MERPQSWRFLEKLFVRRVTRATNRRFLALFFYHRCTHQMYASVAHIARMIFMPTPTPKTSLSSSPPSVVRELGWQTVPASEEVFGAGGTLGRETRRVILLPDSGWVGTVESTLPPEASPLPWMN